MQGLGVFERQEGDRTMKTLRALLILVAALSMCAALSAARAAQENRNGVGEGLAERIQDLHLTDEQETKIADIQKECRPKVEEAAKELSGLVKEEMEKIHPVLTAEQREKLQAMRAERKEHRGEGLAAKLAHLKELHLTEGEMSQIHQLRTEFRPKIAKAMEGFKGILNDEQRKSREQALLAGKKHREVLESLNLTAAQKEKAAEVGKEVRNIVREEMEKIRDVLSEGQQEKLAELKDERHDRARDRLASAIVNSREVNLTEEQKASIGQIRAEFRPKIHEAGNKLRAAVRSEMEMILAVIKGT
jgi:Spy/CpxP family protein refolding chaperone